MKNIHVLYPLKFSENLGFSKIWERLIVWIRMWWSNGVVIADQISIQITKQSCRTTSVRPPVVCNSHFAFFMLRSEVTDHELSQLTHKMLHNLDKSSKWFVAVYSSESISTTWRDMRTLFIRGWAYKWVRLPARYCTNAMYETRLVLRVVSPHSKHTQQKISKHRCCRIVSIFRQNIGFAGSITTFKSKQKFQNTRCCRIVSLFFRENADTKGETDFVLKRSVE